MATNKPTIPCPGLKRSCVAYPFSVVCMLIDPFSVVNCEAMSNSEGDPLEPLETEQRLELSLYRYSSPAGEGKDTPGPHQSSFPCTKVGNNRHVICIFMDRDG